MSALDTIKSQIDELTRGRIKPSFIILDHQTWNRLRSDKNAREVIWYGQEQRDPYTSDKILGIPVAILTGHETPVIKVK